MAGPVGRPTRERAGEARVAIERAARPTPTPELANAANVVNAAPEKPTLESGDFLALVESDGTITPLSVATLQTFLTNWLQATYVMVPQP